MKKIFLFAAVAVSALLSSCDLEKLPDGSIPSDEALENPVNARNFRNGFYITFRSLQMSGFETYCEVQMDNFQALKDTYGNALGNIFKGDFNSATSDFAGAFSLLYGNISEINFYLPKLEKLIESDEYSNSDHLKMIRYRGEAHFFRAYNYMMLFNYFCQDYSDAKKDVPALGLPLVTDYNPTTDRDVYPGRSTMAETFELIFSDLDQAEQDIQAYEDSLEPSSDDYSELVGPSAAYINTYVIQAFRARIALARGEKELAAELADGIINCGLYSLSSVNDYANLWLDGGNTNSEVIMMCAVTNTEAMNMGQSNSYYWSYNTNTAMYVPTNSVLNMYQSGDIRPQIYFASQYLDLNGNYVPVYTFSKYYGAKKFSSNSSSRGCCVYYPFRLAEMYLIKAECDPSLAEQNAALKALRQARATGAFRYRSYTADQIQEQVRLERNRELIGEGFRLTDLRRYGEGFTRDSETPQPNFAVEDFNTLYFVQGAMDLHYDADDYRFVWPIPSTEIQVNPQIVGQQNPGY